MVQTVHKRSFAVVLLSFVLVLTMLTPMSAGADPEIESPHVLVFSRTSAFRHASIPAGIAAIEQLGAENGFTVSATENQTLFTPEYLAQFDAVIWLSTTGNTVLNAAQQAAFEGYIQSGGGYVGIHAAADTHYNWEWYGGLVGAYFSSHPPGMQNGDVWVTDQAHPSTEMLPSVWNRTEEFYHFQTNPRGDVHVLATLDEASYRDNYPNYNDWMGTDHPIAWCQNDYDGGRSWYTAGGHDNAHFSEDLFLEHLTGGILWAARAVDGDCGGTVWDNYAKVVLNTNTSSLMKMDIANDGRVFYTQRAGGLFVIDPDTDEVSTVANMNVFSGHENGLMGIALDPDFDNNSRIWLYYSPPNSVVGDNPRQFLSNFELSANGTLDLSSEQVVLEVPHQRSECCHAAGHLEFGPDGDLWLSIGDDTNPFASDGYAPIDERPGRSAWDAQRSSANTNDLRGSLLRITPTADGSDYTIPEGNLFEPGTANTRPEIHTMGLRNPFTFSVDENSTVYLGDYGPDAGSPNPNRGPQNQVTWHIIDEAQNAGWPYCKGNNSPYVDFNFATSQSGEPFDCLNLVNDSPNNTGLTNLPPATPATIWYSYDPGSDFPMLVGGAPTGGPRYEFDPNLDSDIKWPASFDGSVIFGEWGRNQLFEIALTDDGLETTQIARTLPNISVSAPHDFAFSPYDGALYILEWGGGFGDGGPNSRVSRIEYHGAQSPQAPQVSVTATPNAGDAPLAVDFQATAVSPVDADIVSYQWDFGDGTATGSGASVSHTYEDAGTYQATVTVTDDESRIGTASVTVTVLGDEPPPGGDLSCPAGLSDDFSGSAVHPRWSETVREDPAGYSIGDGSLTVDVPANDIYGTDNTNTPNIFLQSIPDPSEPWEATLQLTMEAYQSYQQAGLIVYGDDDNYAKMVLQGRSTSGVNPANRVFQFIREENAQPNEVNASNTPQLGAEYPDTVWVRFTSNGSNLQAWYSADGESFTAMPETKQMAGIDNPRIGLFAVAGNGQTPTTADFEDFVFSPDVVGERPELHSDDFDGNELDGCRWDRVVNYAPEFLEVSDGALRIEVQPGDIYEGSNDDIPNLILQTQPDGDWTVETRYTEALLAGYSQGGLMVYVDDDNYVKFDTVADVGQTGVNRVELRSEVNGSIVNPQPQVSGGALPANDGEWWLRLSKEGDSFSGSFSVDGENWTDIAQSVPNALAAAEGAVGVFTLGAQETTTTTVSFDYFHLLSEREEAELEVELTASTRCVAGRVFVAVTARNDVGAPMDVEFESDFGNRAFTGVVADRFASHAFNTRATTLEDGSVTVRATADVDGEEVTSEWTVDYTGLTC